MAVIRVQVLDEATLALIERRRRDLYRAALEEHQRLVEVPAEPDGLDAAELPGFEVACLNGRLQLIQLLDNLLLRLLDQDAMSVLGAGLPDDEGEIGIVPADVPVLQVRQLPLALPERVVPLGVLAQQAKRHFLPDAHALERIERAELREHLVQALGGLPERERRILSLYYEHELTLAEIGVVIGVGESRVSQLRTQAIARLRSRLRETLQVSEAR